MVFLRNSDAADCGDVGPTWSDDGDDAPRGRCLTLLGVKKR